MPEQALSGSDWYAVPEHDRVDIQMRRAGFESAISPAAFFFEFKCLSANWWRGSILGITEDLSKRTSLWPVAIFDNDNRKRIYEMPAQSTYAVVFHFWETSSPFSKYLEMSRLLDEAVSDYLVGVSKMPEWPNGQVIACKRIDRIAWEDKKYLRNEFRKKGREGWRGHLNMILVRSQ
jgi:hypothetical protein